jgi:hypothetical protein
VNTQVTVRARIKSLSDLPDWAKCCLAQIATFEGMKDSEFSAVLGTDYKTLLHLQALRTTQGQHHGQSMHRWSSARS